MTFTEKETNAIEIDMDTEWIYDDERQKCIVDFFFFLFIRDRVLAFLNIDLDNVYTDMWLDATAMIDPKERVVLHRRFSVNIGPPQRVNREDLSRRRNNKNGSRHAPIVYKLRPRRFKVRLFRLCVYYRNVKKRRQKNQYSSPQRPNSQSSSTIHNKLQSIEQSRIQPSDSERKQNNRSLASLNAKTARA